MLIGKTDPFVRKVVRGLLNKHSKNDIHTWLQTPDCRLFYIVKGKGKMVIEDKTYELKPGCCILFQGGTKYIWQTDDAEGVTYIAVNFDYTQNHSHLKKSYHPYHSENFSDDKILEKIEFEDSIELNSPVYLEDMTVMSERMHLLATEFLTGGEYVQELLSSALKSIIINIVRIMRTHRIKVDNRSVDVVRRIIEYIQNNYNKELKNETIGELFHFNPLYINRIFKEQTGVPIHKFIVNYRISIACELLGTEQYPVNEIAAMVGFNDIPHFTKTFKAYKGRTPKEYRK